MATLPRNAVLALMLASGLQFGRASETEGKYNIGRAPSAQELAAWDIDVAPDGKNLPAGVGTVARGKAVYDAQCAACHGIHGEGGMADVLVGGMGTLASPKALRTVGSYWPYATTLFDYVRRAMPLNAPQSLSSEDVYSVSAYLLHLNGILAASGTLDATSLPRVRMPNRDGFVSDPRPDVPRPR